MFRFLHAADIHLDSPLRGLELYEDAPAREILGATRRAFDNLIELAVEEQVCFVLLVCDLYDGDWKDYNTGLYLADRLGRLNRDGIRVFIVSGNHNAANQITKDLHLPENVMVFSAKKPDTFLFEELRVAIHGQGYLTRVVPENLAVGYPPRDPHYFNIGLLHTALTGRQGHETYAPCSLDILQTKGYDYGALGHVHCREIVNTTPWVVFPGNLQGRQINEPGAKGATLVIVDNGRVTDIEHRDLDVLRWVRCEVDLSGCDNGDMVYKAVRMAFEKEQTKNPDENGAHDTPMRTLQKRCHGIGATTHLGPPAFSPW